jgi:hypothetical protein
MSMNIPTLSVISVASVVLFSVEKSATTNNRIS